ncbi:hypothetical protein HDU96_005226 [Phlyctochytrium bullatum]|nr:hypothetical protein HDU96_005226 [Phlyctochytrium bullatum]
MRIAFVPATSPNARHQRRLNPIQDAWEEKPEPGRKDSGSHESTNRLQELLIEDWLNSHPAEAERIIARLGGAKSKQREGSSQQPLRTEKGSQAAPEWQSRRPSLELSRLKPISERYSDLFFELARSIYTSLDISEIISKVLIIAVALMHAERCLIFLLDESKDELFSTEWDVAMKSTSSEILSSGSFSRSQMGLLEPHSAKDLLKMLEKAEEKKGGEGRRHQSPHREEVRFKVGKGIIGQVAKTGVPANISNTQTDPRFNEDFDIKMESNTHSMLCLPIFAGGYQTAEGSKKILGVSCLINKISFSSLLPSDSSYTVTSFTDEDESIFRDFLFLVGIAINNSELFKQLREKEKEASEEMRKVHVLLDVAKSLYHENSTEELCKKIIVHARDLTHADKASCFFVDKEMGILYSAIFDSSTGKKFTMPMSKGIAGFVASTGHAVNLKNAYEDPRFNDEVDRQTGYKTVSLLCYPILGPNSDIVGVTNLINKTNADQIVPFSKSDEEILEAFSSFCGICIHKTLLLEEIKKSRMQVEVALELMSYHAAARTEDLIHFCSLPLDRVPLETLQDPDFDCHDYEPADDRLVWLAYDMFESLGFLSKFAVPEKKMLIYILTVRKNYRNNAYHNFTHAVSVLHGIYILFCRDIYKPYGLSTLEAFAMAVAALNHDIDHRGTNNQFQKTAHTALANFYSTSVMERHHFNHAMTILNSPGHNILDQLDSVDYKTCLELIEHAILATDLALYFKNKTKVLQLSGGNYKMENAEHRELLRGITMTCVDLSAMFKPWEKARQIANTVYLEFFEQGDEERKLGLPYSSDVMNRANESQIPKLQVEFYDHIVNPAFETLNIVLDNSAEFIYTRVRQNHENWKRLRDSNDGHYRIQLHGE